MIRRILLIFLSIVVIGLAAGTFIYYNSADVKLQKQLSLEQQTQELYQGFEEKKEEEESAGIIKIEEKPKKESEPKVSLMPYIDFPFSFEDFTVCGYDLLEDHTYDIVNIQGLVEHDVGDWTSKIFTNSGSIWSAEKIETVVYQADDKNVNSLQSVEFPTWGMYYEGPIQVGDSLDKVKEVFCINEICRDNSIEKSLLIKFDSNLGKGSVSYISGKAISGEEGFGYAFSFEGEKKSVDITIFIDSVNKDVLELWFNNSY